MHVSVEVQCWLVDFADHVISPGAHAVWPVDSSVYHFLGQLVLSTGHARWGTSIFAISPEAVSSGLLGK
ncbi:hypothetical protein D2E28_21450 [Mycobacteroides abscessus]|nr:hypothetical protein DDJ52_22965 [Mycobacteroides abscessus]PVB41941.1 hypothetical protein DDJ39_01665 [Mycobacteroides abscessus]RIR20300.1 hypothetical protein D2E28_21450 [Mycobacteroides abscessus]RIT67175.1 hypothetical protein D2E90_08110 [Mycobacteroides abscessus]